MYNTQTFLNMVKADADELTPIDVKCVSCLTTTPRVWKEEAAGNMECNFIIVGENNDPCFDSVTEDGEIEAGFFMGMFTDKAVLMPKGHALLCIDCFEGLCNEAAESIMEEPE